MVIDCIIVKIAEISLFRKFKKNVFKYCRLMIIPDKNPGSTQYIIVHNIYVDLNYSLL